MPDLIDMCEFYSVELKGNEFKPTCKKGHKAALKCHIVNPDCPDYRQGIACTLEEIQERLRKEVAEILLEVRQYLCNTEFAEEPFRKPWDPNKLTIEFPNQILALFDRKIRAKLNAEVRIELGSKAFEKGKKCERERIDDLFQAFVSHLPKLSRGIYTLSVDDAMGFRQALKGEK